MQFDMIKTGRERGKCRNCGRKEADHRGYAHDETDHGWYAHDETNHGWYAHDETARTCDPADIAARAKVLKRRAADRERRAAINEAMGSIGLVRVKGTNGGTYWE